MRSILTFLMLGIFGCATTHKPMTQVNSGQTRSTAVAKPVPVPPEMERRDIQGPPYLDPEGR